MLTKAWLYSQYIKQKKSAQEIADASGLNKMTILRHLRKYKIKVRNRSQANKIKKATIKIELGDYILTIKRKG